MRSRLRAHLDVRKGELRWWLVYGPVRSGTTLMSDLTRTHTRYLVSDWGLHHALTPPLSRTPHGYDAIRPQRALLAEVLSACRTGSSGPLDLMYKQANLRQPELATLTALIGPPERSILCLRDPAGFMASATRKFPDVPHDELREFNYLGTLKAWEEMGGEIFLYHPDVTGQDYQDFLAPLRLAPDDVARVRYTGSTAPELTTDAMWERFHELAALAVNRV
jgi:hypothetical protein